MGKMNYITDFAAWEEEFQFYQNIKVRFFETDMFGHLNNSVPFTYFELARIEFFKQKGFMQEWIRNENETIPVVADLQCDFLQQVFFDENLNVYVKANSIGNTSVDLHYMGKKEDGSVCFTGRGAIVQMSKKTGKGIPWTDEMRALLLNGSLSPS